MNKKKSVMHIVLCFILLTCLGRAIAGSSINIDFTGNIIVLPCFVNISMAGLPVNLGRVDVRDLKLTGDGTTPVGFSIDLTNCPPGTQSVAVKFSGNTDKDTTLLALDKNGATGVAIEIRDGLGKKIPINTTSSFISINSGNVSIPFSARYVATEQYITAGTGNASADFDIIYP